MPGRRRGVDLNNPAAWTLNGVSAPAARRLVSPEWPDVRENLMRNWFLGAAAVASLLSASFVVGGAQAQGRLIVAIDRGDAPPMLQDAQFLFGGRTYCWYASGWRGAGFYWCGYAQRRGLGWGGGAGWNGWQGGGRGGYAGGARPGHAVPDHAVSVRSSGARTSTVRTTAARGGGHAGATRTASRGGGGGHAGGQGGGHKPGE